MKKEFSHLISFFLSSPPLNRVCNKEEASEKTTGAEDHTIEENQSINGRSTSEKQGVWDSFVATSCATYMTTRKKVGRWCALLVGKVQETVQRCKTVWKNRMPSVKVHWPIKCQNFCRPVLMVMAIYTRFTKRLI